MDEFFFSKTALDQSKLNTFFYYDTRSFNAPRRSFSKELRMSVEEYTALRLRGQDVNSLVKGRLAQEMAPEIVTYALEENAVVKYEFEVHEPGPLLHEDVTRVIYEPLYVQFRLYALIYEQNIR